MYLEVPCGYECVKRCGVARCVFELELERGMSLLEGAAWILVCWKV